MIWGAWVRGGHLHFSFGSWERWSWALDILEDGWNLANNSFPDEHRNFYCVTLAHTAVQKKKFCIAQAWVFPEWFWGMQFQNSYWDEHRLAQHDTFSLSYVKYLVVLPSSRVNLCLATPTLPPGTKHAIVKHWNAQCDSSPWNWDRTRELGSKCNINHSICSPGFVSVQSVCVHSAQFPWGKRIKK